MKRKIVLITIGTLVIALVGCLVWYWFIGQSIPKTELEEIESSMPAKKLLGIELGATQVSVKKLGLQEAQMEFRRRREADRYYEGKVPINFWGKVVDQFGNPVEGARVDMDWTDLSIKGSSNRTVYTDTQGKFSLTGVRGKNLGMFIEKEGYYRVSGRENQTSFEYASPYAETYFEPDKDNPVVFLMRKKGTPANLIKGDFTMKLHGEGVSGGIDFFKGKAVEEGQGQMQVTVWKYSDFSERRENNISIFPYDWAITIKFPDGGFVEHNDVFPFLAPESGYVSEFSQRWHVEGQHVGSGNRLTKQWYFRVGNPPRYGRMTFGTYGNMPNFNIGYYLNPTPNDRNLESANER